MYRLSLLPTCWLLFVYNLLLGGCFVFGARQQRPWQVQAGYSVSGVFGSRVNRPEVIEGD